MKLPALPAPQIDDYMPSRLDLRALNINARRTVAFTEDVAKGEYYVNGKIWDHERIDTRVPLGTVEEWTIRNDSGRYACFPYSSAAFPGHGINGKAEDFNGYLDTVRVPERGQVKYHAIHRSQMIGEFVYHCHVLEHEDKGMMANIEVYDPKKEDVLSNLGWKNYNIQAH